MYDDIPAPEKFGFMGTREEGPYMGVELEVEVTEDTSVHDCVDYARNLIGNFVTFKSDGSLDNGFEMNSAPATLNTHKEYWPRLLRSDLISCLSSFETDTCGMHVHLDLKALNPIGFAYITRFMFNDRNKDFLRRVAGRKPNNYCMYPGEYNSGYDGFWAGLADDRFTNTRYNILNLQPAQTIEFRLFKGTLSERGLLKNVEFVDSLAQFGNQQASLTSPIDVREYAEYVKSKGERYANLNNWMESRVTAGRRLF